jgi:hypothetical protein
MLIKIVTKNIFTSQFLSKHQKIPVALQVLGINAVMALCTKESKDIRKTSCQFFTSKIQIGCLLKIGTIIKNAIRLPFNNQIQPLAKLKPAVQSEQLFYHFN